MIHLRCRTLMSLISLIAASCCFHLWTATIGSWYIKSPKHWQQISRAPYQLSRSALPTSVAQWFVVAINCWLISTAFRCKGSLNDIVSARNCRTASQLTPLIACTAYDFMLCYLTSTFNFHYRFHHASTALQSEVGLSFNYLITLSFQIWRNRIYFALPEAERCTETRQPPSPTGHGSWELSTSSRK